MKIKNVAIITDSPKVYKNILDELKRRNVQVSENSEVKIVIDSVKERSDILKYVGRIIAISRGKQEFNELLIGIDTNSPYLTIVAIIDGELIEYRRSYGLQPLINAISEILITYPAKRKIIGVGIGNKYGEEIYRVISAIYENVKSIDEKYTNAKSPFNQIKDKDIRAAYSIALRASS
ncbi:hypothetical protein SULI_09390 [Saccharolobus solfataricus]|uniref:Uncharacterized protein n=2 Tax=Saccharolobus solfataricus TaxID=2287 RepID=A0A0E3MEQ7_SACSO|nr:hypothetical protein [Saccharolobus solfataricus]AKA74099.1 hypothetical protein SULB_1870 [Saccharolobus solfataricus]AKA76797.1 hypothetical protein SULC_1868 [Saccharolobus solfataricus]AKA79490.1 hypothetical protein SULA_1869 [Saccharolobus solfataricus]AZF68578.1 hypothetical protein SULG_09390 [Saccharolobus solfataricus]AZF71198.1 hypothetical protein SULH_09390 [Saccharolobus solfataricus]